METKYYPVICNFQSAVHSSTSHSNQLYLIYNKTCDKFKSYGALFKGEFVR